MPPEIHELRTEYFGTMQNPTKAKLILIRGDEAEGQVFNLNASQHVVGSDEEKTGTYWGGAFNGDPFISPRHANFFYRDGALVVRDEGSLNGIYIRIRGSVPLSPSQTFLAGEQLFEVSNVGPIDDDGPDEDGTVFYSSPRKESSFSVQQVFRGGAAGMTVHSDGREIFIGRDGADLNFAEDMFISAKHCSITSDGQNFTLTDLESRNGTYVRLVDDRVLKHGDYLFIGQKLLRVELNTN